MADPDLVEDWAHDWSLTTAEKAAWQLCRFNGELTKIGEEWFLSETNVAAADGRGKGKTPRPGSALAPVALQMAWEEAEQLLSERQTEAGQGCHASAPFGRLTDHSGSLVVKDREDRAMEDSLYTDVAS